MADASDITEKFYARFLEGVLGDMAGKDVSGISIIYRTADGCITTNYCEMDTFDKVMFAHVLQSDAMWDDLEANAGVIREIVEDADVDGEDEEE